MAEQMMTPQEAIDALRSLRGAVDAMKGFHQAFEKLEPMLRLLDAMEATRKALLKSNEDLKKENAGLEDVKARYNARVAEANKKFDADKALLDQKINALHSEITDLNTEKVRLVTENEGAKTLLGMEIADLQAKYDATKASFEAWKKERGL